MTVFNRTQMLIDKHGPFGISGAVGSGNARHVVNRHTYKTLCGRSPVSIFGIDLYTRRQVSCLRCHRLAFRGPNSVARNIPDTPIERKPA